MIKLLSILSITVLFSCNSSDSKKADQNTLKIRLEIIPEDDSSYTFTWHDTLGQSKGYSKRDRPYELKCTFIDSKDTAGYYYGLSSPRNFTYVMTTDTVVTGYFEMKLNHFTDAFSIEEHKIMYQNRKELSFDPVKINILKNLRKPFDITLTTKQR